MMPAIEKFYCKSRLHAYIWRSMANKVFTDFMQYSPPMPSVIEIGTGQGLGAIFLAEKLPGSKFVAIDNEQDMVEAAAGNVRKKGLQDRIKAELGDALSLSLPDNSFDMAVAITVLHHVPRYEKAVAEVARVLKRGGIFLIVDFDFKASVLPRLEVLFGRPPSIFTWNEMSEALRGAGFEVLKYKSYGRGMFGSASVKR